MAISNLPMTTQKRYVAHYYLAVCLAAAQRAGHSAAALLAAAGLPQSWALEGAAPARLTPMELTQLIQGLWALTDDEFMGLGTAPCRRGTFALMIEFAARADTLGGFLRRCARFYSVLQPQLTVALVPTGSDDEDWMFRLHLDHRGRDREHLLQEFLLLLVQRSASWLVGQPLPYSRTSFDYPQPVNHDEYRSMFSGRLDYEQPFSGFSLAGRYLLWPLVRSEADIQRFLADTPLLVFRRPVSDDQLVSRLRALLQEHEFSAFPDLQQVADQLHLTPRTLRRKLQQQGTGLERIKDSLRRELALRLLRDEQLSVSHVAGRCGFSEVAAFSRAFQRWAGQAPSHWRRQQQGAPGK